MLRGITDLGGRLGVYCNKCEFVEWCEQEKQTCRLATTDEALIDYKQLFEQKSLKMNREDFSYKSYHLAEKIHSMIEEEKAKNTQR